MKILRHYHPTYIREDKPTNMSIQEASQLAKDWTKWRRTVGNAGCRHRQRNDIDVDGGHYSESSKSIYISLLFIV